MSPHYFSDDEPATKRELRTVRAKIRGRDLQFQVADRVFSTSGLDQGTAVLLSVAPPPPADGTFLDLGCGWGPIALALALESPSAQVLAVDVNSRALDLTRRNAVANRAENIQALLEDEALSMVTSQEMTFDLIWSNPPVRIGKGPLQDLLMRWLPLLAPDGVAYLVIAKNLGSDSYASWLGTKGFNVDRVASKKGFRILKVVRS